MRTRLFSNPASVITLALLAALSITAGFAADDESNLVLLDTQNPAIRDLAEIAEDAATYGGLNDKNKVGVFYSEGLKEDDLVLAAPGFDLLQHPNSSWTLADFFDTAMGPIFATNGAVPLSGQGAATAPIYQRIPTAPLIWGYAHNYLSFQVSGIPISEGISSFKSQLLHPTLKTQIYKRFEFPSGLNREVRGDDPEYVNDRRTISNTAKKLIVVVHGWNTDPDVDPFTKDTWPLLLESIHGQVNQRKVFAPGWDLYAYQWGQDSYTGGLGKMLGFSDAGPHANGGVGVGQENGTQAAEIGYQHGMVLGKLISDHCVNNGIELEKVHFIAHSAGTWVARSASLYLKNEIERQRPASILTQQITLLDPYMPLEGYTGWVEAPGLQGGETSVLGTTKVMEWPDAGELLRCENILSDDAATFGTNERFWVGPGNGMGYRFACRKVGTRPSGLTFGKSDWGGHGGPVNFFAYTVDPNEYLKALGRYRQDVTGTWDQETGVDKDPAGWDFSLLMQEFYAEKPIGMTNEGFSLIADVIGAQPMHSRAIPQFAPAPSSTPSPWKQILLDVDSVGWVRAMFLPVAGGAPELAGPVRPEPDGRFLLPLKNGSVLTGTFDTTVVPAAVSLAIDGVAFGQKTSTSQGGNPHAGVDAVELADGKVVISLILPDGTAGMVARRNGENTGWEGAGSGTVDLHGNFSMSGADGFRASGQFGVDGALVVESVAIVPPQVPEIHVTSADGAALVSGVATKDFGASMTGQSSTAYAVTIRNTGVMPLTGLGLSLAGGHPGDFAASGLTTNTLLPDASVVIRITFRPQASGLRNAALRLASNDRDENPFSIHLSGTGVIPPAPKIEILYGGKSLKDGISLVNLGSTKINGTLKKTFTIRNSGKAALSLGTITKTGKHSKAFIVSKPVSSSLAPGASTTFTVIFKPKGKGIRSAAIRVANDDKIAGPYDIKLKGTGLSSVKKSTTLADLVMKDFTPASGMLQLPVTGSVVLPDGAQYLTLTMAKTRSSDHPVVEVSPNLMDWYSGPLHTSILQNDEVRLRVRDNTPVTPENKRFIRVKP